MSGAEYFNSTRDTALNKMPSEMHTYYVGCSGVCNAVSPVWYVCHDKEKDEVIP